MIDDAGLIVVDAWARPTPSGASEAAFYVTIENRGAPDDRLIGAASPRCMVVTPHLTTFDEDVASMIEAGDDELGLSPDERVEMEPNGLHLMCLGLDEPLEIGDTVDVQLQFSHHPPVTAPVTIEQR